MKHTFIFALFTVILAGGQLAAQTKKAETSFQTRRTAGAFSASRRVRECARHSSAPVAL